MEKLKVANGIWWVEVPEADLRILCGCPADSVKHLMKRGLIQERQKGGVSFETGPNAILLSDTPSQKGSFANLSEFPVLQMLYRQGMIIPNHPNNTGRKPMLIGLEDQVRSQSEYIFRGNYGLASEEELTAAGMPAPVARESMRVKRWFAFGSIRRTEDLVDMRAVSRAAVELVPGVYVHRKGLNRYEFLSGGEAVEVDLNLGPHEEYQAPYDLGSRVVRREYFSVIHIGEGDGWNPARPCMGSIVCFQGRLYLIDAGPNIISSLAALGISVNEIEGIFHTHCHDDHFAGLTSLVRSDRRLRSFAVPWVRASIEKKLSALMGLDAKRFGRLFEVHDLASGEWTSIDGLEVRPVDSPHPVETTVLFFRASWEHGHKTYAHLADLPSVQVLDQMATKDGRKDGMSPAARETFLREILQPVDVKKVDAGGGIIHGHALDFQGDGSRKVIFSHLSVPLKEEELELGSTASFGLSDILIPVRHQAYLLRSAYRYLRSYFPGTPGHELDLFTNYELATFNAGTIMIKKAESNQEIYLILSGVAEVIAREEGFRNRLSAGALVGELSGFLGEPSQRTFRAASHVTALRIPCETYRQFVSRNGLDETVRRVHENRRLLFNSRLFGDMTAFNAQSAIARVMVRRTLSRGEIAPHTDARELYLLGEGEITLLSAGLALETLRPGDHWGEGAVLGGMPAICEAQAERDCVYFAIPEETLTELPSVQWNLLESFDRRMKRLRTKFRFEWQDFYSVGVPDIDEQHRTLFTMINELAECIEGSGIPVACRDESAKLLAYTRFHFEQEEKMLAGHGYAGLEEQHAEHARLLGELGSLVAAGASNRPGAQSPSEFFKDWLIDHTLLEDRRFKIFLSDKTAG
jgi:hemerythrin